MGARQHDRLRAKQCLGALARLGGRGKPQPITALDPARGEFSHRWPEILPDGKSVLFAVGTEGSWDDAEIAVQTIGANDRRTVVQGGTSPRLSSSGHLLYIRGGLLYSRPFDGRRQESGGQPVPKVARIIESSDGAGQFSISRAGTLAYVPASSGESDRTLVWVGRDDPSNRSRRLRTRSAILVFRRTDA